MTKDKTPPDTPAVRKAKAAASEAIGKLIGDDAAVRAGRKEQAKAAEAGATKKTKEQE